ncbi:hypothetical protein KYC5002_00670 [Archangium violaceum]|uniref:hypothetical protein n=1 Tax=Archangium violaceum TaxID=83451 RepID=UPI002B2A2DF3|nr:hypothetical protein KYC5002_00670 [Archangium gephyra]
MSAVDPSIGLAYRALVASTGPRCPPWLPGRPGGLYTRPSFACRTWLPGRPGGLYTRPSFACHTLVAFTGPELRLPHVAAGPPWWPSPGPSFACRTWLPGRPGGLYTRPSFACHTLVAFTGPELRLPHVAAGPPWWPSPGPSFACHTLVAFTGPELRLPCPGGLYRPEGQPTRKALPGLLNRLLASGNRLT